jgi:hypothetical protein
MRKRAASFFPKNVFFDFYLFFLNEVCGNNKYKVSGYLLIGMYERLIMKIKGIR